MNQDSRIKFFLINLLFDTGNNNVGINANNSNRINLTNVTTPIKSLLDDDEKSNSSLEDHGPTIASMQITNQVNANVNGNDSILTTTAGSMF
jgi:hypothetical protein